MARSRRVQDSSQEMPPGQITVLPRQSALQTAAWTVLSGPDGLVFGSYLHGLFDNLEFTGAILTRLAEKKGISLTAKAQSMEEYKESQYDKLADLVRQSLDMEAVYKIMEEYES